MQIYDSAEATGRAANRWQNATSEEFNGPTPADESGRWVDASVLGDSVETVETHRRREYRSVRVLAAVPRHVCLLRRSGRHGQRGVVSARWSRGLDTSPSGMLPEDDAGAESCLIHITQACAQKQRDGYIGLRDFRGPLVAEMVAAGWTHYGEITVDKNPQVKATRTKARGLMFATLDRDAAEMHVAMADMILHFRAPGDNPEAVKPECSREEWIRWARPVWMGGDDADDGIVETDTLNAAIGRQASDERHICPLQLGLMSAGPCGYGQIAATWSIAPFTGIGSEGVVAVQLGRRFVGGELKPSYFTAAVEHVRAASAQGRLW